MSARKSGNGAVKTALVLRSCNEDMSSQNGFVWPGVGEVATAPDWIANDECGSGLHGWLYGQGDHSCSSYLDATSKWLVVEVEEAGIIMLGGKCKFESDIVRFVGTKTDAAAHIIANEPRAVNVAVIGASLIVGDSQAVTVGALGTATAGDSGTATAGANGEIRIKYWDTKADRYRTKSGYIGEEGLIADTAYRLDANNNFVAVVPAKAAA